MDAENNEQNQVKPDDVQQDVNKGGEASLSPPPAPQATSGSYFKNRNEKDRSGTPVTIGDITFLVGRPSLASLTKQGIVPSELAAKATNVQQKMAKNRPVTGKELEDYSQYERLMVKASLRSPQIVDENPNYEAGQILFEDLSDMESTELMMFIQGGDEALRQFRVQRQRQIARLGSETLSDDEA